MAKASNKRSSSNSSKQPKQETRQVSNQTANGFLAYGNQDKDEKYDLSEMRVNPDHYVVRHFNVETLPSGAQVEDEGSSRIQIYEKEVFDSLSGQVKKGKGKQAETKISHFEALGLNVEILHKPE